MVLLPLTQLVLVVSSTDVGASLRLVAPLVVRYRIIALQQCLLMDQGKRPPWLPLPSPQRLVIACRHRLVLRDRKGRRRAAGVMLKVVIRARALGRANHRRQECSLLALCRDLLELRDRQLRQLHLEGGLRLRRRRRRLELTGVAAGEGRAMAPRRTSL